MRNTATTRLISWVLSAVGVALIVVSVVVLIRRRADDHQAAPHEEASAEPSAAPAPAAVPWTTLLGGPRCEAPCCGGESCAVDALNGRDYPQFCRPGSKTCAACLSDLKCIPGGCELELADGETWNLRVSAVRGGSPPRSVCEKDDAALRVCAVKEGGVRACWTNAELCANRGPVLPVSTADLRGRGIDIELQSADGRVVSKAHRAFAEGMRRRGLCTGFVVRGFEPQAATGAGAYGEVQFVLAPP